MAVKKKAPVAKRKVRKKTASRQPDSTERLHELIRRCAELRDSGRLAKARKLLRQMENLQKALQAMEEAMKRPKQGA